MESRSSAAQITTTATEWVARLDRGLSPEEQLEFDHWTAADARHAGALARAQALWVHASRLRVLGPQFVSEAVQPGAPRVSGRFRWLSAAGILLVLVGAATTGLHRYKSTHVTTAVGEIRRIPLSDGSSVTLDTSSRIALNYSNGSRVVRLTVGEAIFEVAHDRARPFIVEAGPVRVRAVGTAFMVRFESDSKVQVTVTRGVVDVWTAGEIINPAVRVAADRRVIASPDRVEPVVELSNDDVVRSVAWQDGILDLQGRTLGQAAAEFNRYNEQSLSVEDPALAAQPVVGRFNTSDPRGFAEAAAAMLDAHVRIDRDHIVLERRRLP